MGNMGSMGSKPERHIGLGYFKVTPKVRENVNAVLTAERLSYGRFSKELEDRFAKIHQSKHSVFCNSGTSALQIALAALKEKYGWKDGDEVLVPAITWVATSNVVLMLNLKPVFVDVHPLYYNIDTAKLEERITPRTRAIIPVHLFGQPCDMDPILEIANRYGLRIVEDSCETMFATYKGRSVGSFGDYGCFSTYIAHLLVTGVGGLITTQDDDLAIVARSLLAHGRDSIYLSIDDDDLDGDENRLRKLIERRFSFDRIGYSYRATELEAAIGCALLDDWEDMIFVRQINAAYLTHRLNEVNEYRPGTLQLPATHPDATHSFMMYPIVLDDSVDREALLLHLERNGIETRYMLPLINQKHYVQLFGNLEPEYPVAAKINRSGFYIGCHQGLMLEDLDYIVDKFHSFFGSYA